MERKLPCPYPRSTAGVDRQRLRRELHPNQGAVAAPYHAFDYVSCRIGKILRETAGGGRGTDYPVDSKQISSGAVVSERICRRTLQEKCCNVPTNLRIHISIGMAMSIGR